MSTLDAITLIVILALLLGAGTARLAYVSYKLDKLKQLQKLPTAIHLSPFHFSCPECNTEISVQLNLRGAIPGEAEGVAAVSTFHHANVDPSTIH